MSEKIKVINNIKSILGVNVNPSGDGFKSLPKQGAFMFITEDEIDYIYVNQEVIQKGMLWIDDRDIRVKLGIESESGHKENQNVVQYDEIVELVQGHHKRLESALKKIDEPMILQQFVEVARDLKIDSLAKTNMIEEKSQMIIFPDDEE